MAIDNCASEAESSVSEEDKSPQLPRKKNRQLHKESEGKML
jgi:hypothetical protein